MKQQDKQQNKYQDKQQDRQKKWKSRWNDTYGTVLTFAAAAMIVGAGYLGIVKGGRFLLSNETQPEAVEYSNTSSTVFYGKIEDDIVLFPWNYYTAEDAAAQSSMLQAAQAAEKQEDFSESASEGEETENVQEAVDVQYVAEEKNYPYWSQWYRKNMRISEEEMFRSLIAFGCDTTIETIEAWYEQKGRDITQSMLKKDTEVGTLFFYQEELEIDGVRYQVKLACDDWNILNISCYPVREENIKETPEWEKGKEHLTRMLQEYTGQGQIEFFYLTDWYTGTVREKGGVDPAQQASCYIVNIQSLNERLEQGELTEESKELYAKWSDEFQILMEDYYGYYNVDMEMVLEKYNQDYTCQMVEMKDMILVLLQGEDTIGLFYDPISEKFCGYNFFQK